MSCIAAAAATLLIGDRARAADPGPPYPRLGNVYLHGGYDAADIPMLARWDLLVLDPKWSRAHLQQLRALNPDIKLFFYVCAYCMQVPPDTDAWRTQNYQYAQTNNLWWRKYNQGIASDWPGSQMVNITSHCPTGPQGKWRQYIAARVENLVDTYPELDGVFFDNFWKSISWEQANIIQVDSDCNPTHNPSGCNGIMDSNATVDTLWNTALRGLASDVRTRFNAVHARRGGRPLAIMTNRSDDYFPWLNGTLHEYFVGGLTTPDPGNAYGYNWNFEMFSQPGGYLVAPFQSTPYRVTTLNAEWTGTWDAPDRSPDFERHKRFTLASTLMGDGYYSLDAAGMGHGSLWWEPEYDHGGRGQGYLGYPLGDMQRIGVPTGPELIANGSFVGTVAPWSSLPVLCTGTATVDLTAYNSAPSSLKINVSSWQTGGSFKIYQNVVMNQGRGYTLSFWAKASTPQNIILHIYSPSCPGSRCLNDRTIAIGTTWQKYEIPFVSSGSSTAGLNVFVMRAGTVWFDDFTLREGDTSVYRRDFENGIVLLNYTTTPRVIDLGGTFKNLSVSGSTLYNGLEVTSATLQPSDGLILMTQASPTPAPPPVPEARLDQNTPNPFNPTTSIRYQVSQTERVYLAVYDLRGRLVRTLVNRVVPGGIARTVTWNGTDRYGMPAPSGIYFYKMTTPTFSETKKLTLLK